MTIGAASRVSLACDGTTKVFPVAIQAYAATDLTVILTAPVSAGGGQGTLVLNSDYSLVASGTLSPTAWTLTTLAAAAYVTGYTLQVFANPVQTQQTSYVQGQPFPSLAVQTNLDRLTQMAQRLQDQVNRCIRAPDGDVSPAMLLQIASVRAGGALVMDSNGNIATGIPITQVISTALLAPFLGLSQTGLEAAAGVIPAALQYQPGDPRRYGAAADGVTDDATALLNTLKTGHRVLGGGPQCIYAYTVSLIIPATVQNILADWQGATLKPSGAAAPIIGNINPTSAATTTLTAPPTIGAVVVTVTSATGLVVGQNFWISCASYPAYFGRIKVIAGTTITLDTAAPVTYVGTVNFTAYAPSAFVQRIDWQNARFDGSALTAANVALGQCMRWVGAKVVNIANCECANFSLPSAASTVALCETFFCMQVNIDRQVTHDSPLAVSAISGSAVIIEADECGQVNVANCLIESDSFGVNITRCTQATFAGNILRGQRFWATATSSTLASVRGIKMTACAVSRIINNDISDYVTPVKIDLGFQVIVLGNAIRNVPGTGTTGTLFTDGAIEIAPAAGDTNTHGISIGFNVIENVNGHGILLSDNGGSATALLQAQVVCNRIKGTKGFSVNFVGKDVLISGNHLEDWDLALVGTAALGNSGGGLGFGVTIRDNRYIHNTDPTRPLCQGTGSNVGSINLIDGNYSPTGNPQLGTSADGFKASGTATILTGTTSIAVTFTNPLFRAPTADEITITPTGTTTSAPGLYWVSALTNTGFTFNCATNPGASGFAVSYQAKIKQPYTV